MTESSGPDRADTAQSPPAGSGSTVPGVPPLEVSEVRADQIEAGDRIAGGSAGCVVRRVVSVAGDGDTVTAVLDRGDSTLEAAFTADEIVVRVRYVDDQ